jgi:hypothetical protein
MKTTLATIKRLVETGCAEDVSNKENFKRDLGSTLIYHSVGTSGVNGAALATWDGKIQVVIGRTTNLFIMIR